MTVQTSQQTKVSSQGLQISIHLSCASIMAQASILVSEDKASDFNRVHTVICLILQ